jgi:hypothetical protein
MWSIGLSITVFERQLILEWDDIGPRISTYDDPGCMVGIAFAWLKL